MRFPRLFRNSAYPEIDQELRRHLIKYKGKKVMVVVHVRILHMSLSFEVDVMYLFSKKTSKVLGLKHEGTPATVEQNVKYGKTIADFYSRRGKLRVERVELHFTSRTKWPG